MRTLVALALGLAILLAGCATQASQPPGGGPQPEPALQGKDPDEAAAKSLEVYRTLVTSDDFEALGFKSLDEVAKAELGRSFTISLVPLDRLAQFGPNTKPDDLLSDSGRVIYEVTVGGEVRSSLEVGPIGDVWQGQSFGSPGLIAGIAALRPGADDFIVWVAALNVYFLANRNSDGLFFTPVYDYAQFNFAAGRTMPAADALGQLVEAAKGHDQLPN
jgi:hypothetical protein